MLSVEKPGTPEEILEHHGVLGMKWGRHTSRQFAAQYPTGKSRAHAIRSARVGNKKRRQAFHKETDPVKKAKLRDVYLNHPDRATALRTTRGEKVVLALLASPQGYVGPFAIGVAAGARAGRARIEQVQEDKRLGNR